MRTIHGVAALAAVVLAAGVGTALAGGQDGPTFKSLQSLAESGSAGAAYDGNTRAGLSVDPSVTKAPASTAAASPARGVTARTPASVSSGKAAPRRVHDNRSLAAGLWLGGGVIGAIGGVVLGGMLSGGTLVPVLLGIAGFMVGAGIADWIFGVTD